MLRTAVDLGEPSWVGITSDEGHESREYSPGSIYFADTTVAFSSQDAGIVISLSSKTAAIRYLKIRWNTHLPADGRYLSDEWERGYGTMGFQGLRPNRIMPWYFFCVSGDVIQAFGVEVQANAMCFWQVDSAGVTLVLDVRNGGSGVVLGSRELKVATVVRTDFRGVDSFFAAQEFCRQMCPNPILPESAVYGSNNWYYAYGDSSESEILHDADYILGLTQGVVNPPTLVIDDCWQEHHRLNEYNGGPWKHGNAKFPDMAALAATLAGRGVQPGIWIRLLLNESQEIAPQWRSPLNGCLDPTHPDALAYIAKDVKRMCEWGYRVLKHDFSTFDLFGRWGFEMNPLITEENWHFYDQSMTNAEVVKSLYAVIYETARPYGTIILGCNTIGHLGAGLMHINRIGDDTSGLDWERTRQIGINSLAFRLPQHGAFYEVDADCVGIMGRIDWTMNRQWSDLLARSGTPMFISAKPGVMTAQEEYEMRGLLLIASQQRIHLRPTDWELNDCPELWEDGDVYRQYRWYEQGGLAFSTTATRSIPILSIE
jgi:alpha-galactosidase